MKAKIENGKLVITPESAGEKIGLMIWQETDESIILEGYNLEGYNAQQSVQPTVLCAGHSEGSFVKDGVCQTCGFPVPHSG